MVTMAHPDLLAPIREPTVEDRGGIPGGGDESPAEFGGAVAAFNLAAKAMHHDLLAIADAQHRNPDLEHVQWRHRRALGKDRRRPARQDDGLRREIGKEGVGHLVEGMNLAIDIQLAQAARDKLGDLRPEVDDEKAFMLCHGAGIGRSGGVRKREGRLTAPLRRRFHQPLLPVDIFAEKKPVVRNVGFGCHAPET